MPSSTANYDVKPVSEIPPGAPRSRTGKFAGLLAAVKAQPGTPFQIAVYKNTHGAANRRAALRKNPDFSGFTFEARTVDATEHGGEQGQTWSVLYAIYNG